MINAEVFKAKIQKRLDETKELIGEHVQEVLSVELAKDNVSIPCNLKFNAVCHENKDLLRTVLNVLGFNSDVINDDANDFVVKINYAGSKSSYDYALTKRMIEQMQINGGNGINGNEIWQNNFNPISMYDQYKLGNSTVYNRGIGGSSTGGIVNLSC